MIYSKTLPEFKDLQTAHQTVLAFYTVKLKQMKINSILQIDQLRKMNSPFITRKYYIDKMNWVDSQLIKIRKHVLPPVGEWVEDFPVGEWGTNGLSFEENLVEFIKKKFELCYLTI